MSLTQKEKSILILLNRDKDRLKDLRDLSNLMEKKPSMIRNILFNLNKKNLINHKRKKGRDFFYISSKGIELLFEQHDNLKERLGNNNFKVLNLLNEHHKRNTLNMIEFGKRSALTEGDIMEKTHLSPSQIEEALNTLYKNGFIQYILLHDKRFYHINFSGFNLFRKKQF